MKGEGPKTPREEIEARVTALLLGELAPEQAAALEAEIANDAELQSLQAHLREAITLVREASTIREPSAPVALARLSDERRERLLRYFESEVLPVAQPRGTSDGSWVKPLSLAAAMIALIGGGLLLDGLRQRASRSPGEGFASTATDGIYWDSQSGSTRVLARGEAGESTNSPPEYAEASPSAATDRFVDEQRSEAKRSRYFARAGQAPSPSNSMSDFALAQPSPAASASNAPVPLAAASSPSPPLEPPASPTAATGPARPRLFAGVELTPTASGGRAGSERMDQVEASAPDTFAARSLNESKPDGKDDAAARMDVLAKRAETATLSLEPIPSGLATIPPPMSGPEPASRAPDANHSVELFAGVEDANAPRAPADRDQARGVVNGAGYALRNDASASIASAANALSMQRAAKGSDWFGDVGGIAGPAPTVSGDKLDALGRSSRKVGDPAGDIPYYRGRAIEENGLEQIAGSRFEQQLAGSASLGELSKNFGNLDGGDPSGAQARSGWKKSGEKELEIVTEVVNEKLIAALEKQTDKSRISGARSGELAKLEKGKTETKQVAQQSKEIDEEAAAAQRKPAPAVPQPEVSTRENRFSTFSLNVSDVSFKLAAASLENGTMPDPAAVRSEEFINAFDYRDPEPVPGAPLAFTSDRARYPFAQNRDLLRIGIKTAAAGRQPGRALNVVLLVDNSGSMERADRVRILHEALRVLSGQLQAEDKLSIITFARSPRLWMDGIAGDKAGEATARISEITPQGGTNLSAALDLGYRTALRHYGVQSVNRVVLLTDGAANLGNVDTAVLKEKVEAHRKQGVALDCFGIGWEGYNDDLLEVLSRNGDGRYGFINSVEEAATVFAAQLAGALRVAASDVKVQIEFNPRRVTAYRQVGYAKHQLTKEQFRDNTVDAAEIGAAEAGNGIYLIEVNPRGEGDLATARVRFKVPGTANYREHEWSVPFTPTAPPLEQAASALRLAGTASAFSEWLAGSPYAGEITADALLGLINGVPGAYGADPRPKKLEWMIRQAKSLSGGR